MKKLFTLSVILLFIGCYNNPLEFLEPLENESVPSDYVISDNNYEIVDYIIIRESEPRFFLMFKFPSSGLYQNAMSSLKLKARTKHGDKVGFINITKDVLYEMPIIPPYVPIPFYTKKTIILSADIIKYTE